MECLETQGEINIAILSCHSFVHKQWRESLWRSRAQFVTFIFVTGFAGGKCLAAREVMKELSSKPCQRGRWQMNGSHIFNAVIDTGKNETWDSQLVSASASLDRLLELRVREGCKKKCSVGSVLIAQTGRELSVPEFSSDHEMRCEHLCTCWTCCHQRWDSVYVTFIKVDVY